MEGRGETVKFKAGSRDGSGSGHYII